MSQSKEYLEQIFQAMLMGYFGSFEHQQLYFTTIGFRNSPEHGILLNVKDNHGVICWIKISDGAILYDKNSKWGDEPVI